MDENKQYDFALGGEHKLPTRVKLLNFSMDRINEIKSMEQALKTSTAFKLVFQQLPKHMRRRVMAHNTKRLPRRLRQKHLSQLKKSGMPLKQKRPSRKYRRRPHNLLDDYANRQRRIKWLETHIWHAKRFHMLEKWGFKLPHRPCDKAFRACYRATTKHCLVQDISYISCIEIKGPEDILISKLKSITRSSNGLSIGAKTYLNGNREGNIRIFNGSVPLGTIFFNWKPIGSSTETERTIWIWVHAAFYIKTLKLLKKCLNLEVVTGKGHVYTNSSSQVWLVELKHSLNRFRLTGPLSSAVLGNTLKTCKESNSKWLSDYLKDTNNFEQFLLQCDYWKNLQNSVTAAELVPNHILCLIVLDPRYNTPRTKLKAILESRSLPTQTSVPTKIALGPIWDDSIRSYVKEHKISNAKLNELRSELLVPGTDLQNGEAVPVMLIQNPGTRNENLGYGSGWDLIIPAGWSNSFWQTLVLWGARAGGLKEFNALRFESGQLPFLTPDTEAGRVEEQHFSDIYKQRYFALPPNKRPNYNKLGMIEPFGFNWQILLHDWNCTQNVNDRFSILMDKKILSCIQEAIFNKSKFVLDAFENNSLIPVRLKVEGKGTIRPFARICLPESQDLMKDHLPCESVKVDVNQTLRKEKRNAHRKLLKKLRRERVKARKDGQEINNINLEKIKEFANEMKNLWLPKISSNLRQSCSREIMGCVTFGDFSFTQARNCGVGYITSGALKVLLDQKVKNKVLIRNISSRQYRLAVLDIVT